MGLFKAWVFGVIITTIACDPPPGYADNPDDCDDRRDESHPGADEICDGTMVMLSNVDCL